MPSGSFKPHLRLIERFRIDSQEVQYSDRFGIEVTFAARIQELFPDRRIALIKYSRGGTSIAREAAGRFGCWEPDFDNGDGPSNGINQYDHFLATLRGVWSDEDIDDDGEADTLIPAGIVWMQGESDATVNVEIAERYQANLKRLMDLIRAAMRSDDLPVVIGLISDQGRDETDGKVWDFGDRVRRAQHDFAAADDYAYSDKWHYDSAGYIDPGRQFADQLSAIIAAND